MDDKDNKCAGYLNYFCAAPQRGGRPLRSLGRNERGEGIRRMVEGARTRREEEPNFIGLFTDGGLVVKNKEIVFGWWIRG